MRGRKPKPTVLKIVDGNPGKRPLNADEPQFAAASIECPTRLTGLARDEWERITPILSISRVLTEADLRQLEVYCQAVKRNAQANEILDAVGPVYVNEKGNPVKHPANTIATETAGVIKAFAAAFGLTPSDRSRLKVDSGGESDAMGEFMARKKGRA